MDGPPSGRGPRPPWVARGQRHRGLDGVFEPLSRCLDAASARRIIDFEVGRPVQERIDALAEQAEEGTLNDAERAEYEALINAADFVSILKRKARLHLHSNIPDIQ